MCIFLVVVPANEHRHQLYGVEAIRFGPTLALAYFDRRGVDHDILNPHIREEAVNPKAVAAGIATSHIAAPCESPKPIFTLFDLAEDQARGSSRD